MTADPAVNAAARTAVDTAAPALAWNRPWLGPEEIAEVLDTLHSGWLTTGPKVARFETAVRELTGAEDAFAVSSCTAALHLALLVGEVGPGDEVITPSLTFCAVANVVRHVGATPVLVDIDPGTLNLDADLVAAAVTPRTRAVVAMHYGGHPCDLPRLREIADRHGILLVEDAAHAIGAEYHGRPVGSFGDLTAFSFYANKNITTGEGGMLVGRGDLVKAARLLGRHGIDRPTWQRRGNRGPADYDVVEAGLKYNMSDIVAAIGIHQLPRLDGFIARRAEIARRYCDALAGVPGLLLPGNAPQVKHAWHLYAVRVDLELSGIDRAELVRRLAADGIGTSVHFTPLHLLSRYRDLAATHLPHTDLVAGQLLSLPCYPAMTDDDADRVIDAVARAFDRSPSAAGPRAPADGEDR